jgi:SpoVK/Ycf46/Vps4 family AAA+-type ATPase
MKDLKKEVEELRLLLRSSFPVIVVETAEERRFLDIAENLANLDDKTLFTWSAVRGLSGNRAGSGLTMTKDFGDCVNHIVSDPRGGIYVFLDATPYLEDPQVIRMIRELAFEHARNRITMVFVGSRVTLHPDIQRMSASFKMSAIGPEEVRAIIKEEADMYMFQREANIKADRAAYEMLVQHLIGLSRDDARRMIRQAIEHEGAITMEDVARVLKLKHESLGKDGTLQMVTEIESLENVGGLARLKKWLELRRDAFQGKKGTEGLDVPKGVLLLGVQGAGKSLSARAVAGAWRVPLLRLDFGALYNKFHGETERNLREALETASQMSPAILWMDEIEKGVASDSGSDGGVSRRVLGTLLTWMSERKNRVFMIATANDIESLPPELLRKGRFDEIFFVDLPTAPIRAEIFAIHLKRRKHSVEQFDLHKLAAESDRYSGAEIEQAIVAAAYAAHAEGKPLETAHILSELGTTRPLAVVRAEKVHALRVWAKERTVPTD